MEAWADQLAAQVRGAGLHRAVFAGHSMGGYVVQHVWRRHPELVAGLVLVATTDEPFDEPTKKAFGDLSDAVMFGWGGPISGVCADLLIGGAYTSANPGWVSAWVAEVAGYNLGAIGQLAQAVIHRPDFTGVTPGIGVPVLVLHGTEDAAVPFEKGRELAARIPGARFAAVEGAGHCAPLEQPAAVARALAEFLGSALGVPAAP
jgi:pimeloyl-ACP methyl ester carboxylesterase